MMFYDNSPEVPDQSDDFSRHKMSEMSLKEMHGLQDKAISGKCYDHKRLEELEDEWESQFRSMYPYHN